MQNMYSEGPLSVVTMVKWTGKKRLTARGVTTDDSIGEILTSNLGHPGQ